MGTYLDKLFKNDKKKFVTQIPFNFESLNRTSEANTGTGSSVTVDAGGLQLNAGGTATGLATINSSLPVGVNQFEDWAVTFSVSNDLNSVTDTGSLWLLVGGTSTEDDFVGVKLVYGASTVTAHVVLKQNGGSTSDTSLGTITGANVIRIEQEAGDITFLVGGVRYTAKDVNFSPEGIRWWSIENRKASGTANNVNVTIGYVVVEHTSY